MFPSQSLLEPSKSNWTVEREDRKVQTMMNHEENLLFAPLTSLRNNSQSKQKESDKNEMVHLEDESEDEKKEKEEKNDRKKE